jgi:O-acetyl-ADP-ribose deacetylase (regulator of RNase III)
MTMMGGIAYVNGDATRPQTEGNKILVHICNDVGAWGKGFVLALSRRWPEPEKQFRAWYKDRDRNDFRLGSVQFVQVEPDLWVANLIAQHSLKGVNRIPPIRYEAVRDCLEKVALKAHELDASVHMPRIGCGLAGGKWELIEPEIMRNLVRENIPVTVYDF